MATIKNGYGDQETTIRIYARKGERKAEVWIGQDGQPTYSENDRTGSIIRVGFGTDTLAYASITELIDLRDEINEVIREMAGL